MALGRLASSAQASSIQFVLSTDLAQQGYINYILGNPLNGANLQVASITGQGTPSHSGDNFSPTPPQIKVYFTTGALIDSNTFQWVFAGGGSIDAYDLSQKSWLTGTFQDPSLSSDTAGTTHEFYGTFSATLDSDILSFYGIPGNPVFQGVMDIRTTTESPISPSGDFTTNAILSGTFTVTPVPVPGSLLLMGSGLLGLRGWRRFGKS